MGIMQSYINYAAFEIDTDIDEETWKEYCSQNPEITTKQVNGQPDSQKIK